MPKIDLELDEEQADMLMVQIESLFRCRTGAVRGEELLNEEIEIAARAWTGKHDYSNHWDVVKLAPVYRQLVRAFPSQVLAAHAGHQDNVFEFVEALRAARAG